MGHTGPSCYWRYRLLLSSLMRLIVVSRIAIIVMAFLLSACSPPKRAIVEERDVLTKRQQAEFIGGQLVRIVQSGDTLFSIAFASQLSVKDLTAWNDILDRSRLRVGQRLRLTKPIGFVAHAEPIEDIRREDSLPADTFSKETPNVASTSSRSDRADSKAIEDKAAKNASVKGTSAKKTPIANSAITKASTKPSSASDASSKNKKLTWAWPANGKVVRKFSPSSTQQGIDIKVQGEAQLVVAAADGEVVHVGYSLKGYGNLVILKHSEQFLSAYAHNDKIYVSEGQKLQQRQNIGSVGINNQRERALHFQVRRNGKPVDPLKYLPKLNSN